MTICEMLLRPAVRFLALALLVAACVLAATPATAWSVGDALPLYLDIKANHTHVRRRALPHQLCPRFGIDHEAKLPSLDFDDQFSLVKLRIEFGRGLHRRSQWITVKNTKELPNGERNSRHLEKLTLNFQYRAGVFGRFRRFSYVESFSHKPQPHITLAYRWTVVAENSPHAAIAWLSAASLGLVLYFLVSMSADAINHRLPLVVRDHRDD